MQDQKRKNMKQFLKIKRNQKKQLQKAASSIQSAWQSIKNQQYSQFRNILKQMKVQAAFNFLWSEDELKRTPLMLICSQRQWLQFIRQINEWSQGQIDVKSKLELESSQFTNAVYCKGFWKFHQQLVRRLLTNQQQVSFTKIVQLLSSPQSLFVNLFVKYFEFSTLLTFIPEDKMDKILSQIYQPICIKLDLQENKHIEDYLTMTRKYSIWKKEDYVTHLDQPELLKLKMVNYNFMHELAEHHQLQTIQAIIDKLINMNQNKSNEDLFEEYFGYFNISGETPLDIILNKWSYETMKKIIDKIQSIEEVSLSVNCLNNVITNNKLNQQQVQQMIGIFLNGPLSDHGYLQKIQTKSIKQIKKYQFHLPHFNFESINTTDKAKVLKANGKYKIYPLIGYLQRFMQKPNLLTLHTLMFKSIERKYVKKFYFSAIHQNGSQNKQFQSKNQGVKECQFLESYLNPLMTLVCKIEQNEILEFFFDKLLINYMFVTSWKGFSQQFTQTTNVRLINMHFIFHYCNNNKNLQENNINKKLLEAVTNMKQFDKISDKYDHISMLVKCINKSETMKGQNWLSSKIRQFVHDYIVKYQEQNQKEYPTQQNLKHVLSKQQIQKFKQQQKVEQLKHSEKLQDAKNLYIKNRSLDNLKCFYQLDRSSPDSDHKQYQFFLEVDEDELEKKIIYLFQAQNDFYFKTIRNFYGGSQKKFEEAIDNIQSSTWKIIVRTMLQNRRKTKSLMFTEAILSCKQEHTDQIFNEIIMKNLDKKELLKNIGMAISNKLNLNIFLLHQLRQLQEIKNTANVQLIDQLISRDLLGYTKYFKDQKIEQKRQRMIKMMLKFISMKQQYKYFRIFRQIHPTINLGPVIKQTGRDYIQKNAISFSALQFIIYGMIVDDNPIQYFWQGHKRVQEERCDQQKLNNKKQQQMRQQEGKDYVLESWQLEIVFQELSILTVTSNAQRKGRLELQNFLQKMQTSDMLHFIKETKSMKNKKLLVGILEINLSQGKRIAIVDQYIKEYFLELQGLQFRKLANQPDQSLFMAACFAFCRDHKISFFFKIKTEGQTKTILDRNYVWECSDLQFETFCKYLNIFTNFRQVPNRQRIVQKLKGIFHELYERKNWLRLIKFIKSINTQQYVQLIETTFNYFAKNRDSSENYPNKDEYSNLLNVSFEILEKQTVKQQKQFKDLFENVYIINPEKALNLFNLANRSLYCWTKCLYYRPESATHVLAKQIKLVGFPQKKQDLRFYPMSNYSVHQIAQKKYLIDLMKLEVYFKQQWKQSDQNIGESSIFQQYCESLNRKKMAIFMTPQCIERYSEILSHDELKRFSHLIFTNCNLQTIKGLPKQYLDAYVQKNGSAVKNIQSLKTNVVIELIDAGYISGKKQFWDIISSCRMQIIEYYLAKFDLTIDLELVKSIEYENRDKNLLQRLIQIENQKFVIEFITKYKVFDVFGQDLYQENILDKILQLIALHRRVQILKILLQKFNENHKDIVFMLADEDTKSGFREGNHLYLPKFVTQQNHFYQYYFLLKQSQNHHTLIFDTQNFQERFIFSKEDQDYNQYDFLPQMRKRLIFLNKISRFIPNGTEKTVFRNQLLPTILLNRYIKNYELYRLAMIGQIDCEALISNAEKPFEQIHAKVCILKKHPNINLSDEQIASKFSKQLKIVNKVLELTEIDLKNTDKIDQYLCSNKYFSPLVLTANPEFFFKNINQEKFLSDKIEYLEGFAGAYKFFQMQENLALTKQYIDQCFFDDDTVPLNSNIYGQFRLKYLLIACLINQFQGNGQITKYVAEKVGITDTQQLLLTIASYFSHQKQGINIGFFWDKVHQKVSQISKGQFSNKGKYKIMSKCKIRNANQTLQKILNNEADIFSFISTHRNLSYLQSQLTIISCQIPKTSSQILFEFSQSFSKQDQSGNELYKIPFETISEGDKTVILINCDEIINEIKKIAAKEQIKKIGKFDIFNCLGDLKFVYNCDSLENLKQFRELQKLSNRQPHLFCNSPISKLLQHAQDINNKVSQFQTAYSLSDVFGPFPINDDTNKSKVIDCISFYEFCKLPNAQITLQCITEQSVANGAKLMLSDVKEYIRYFQYDINDDQDINKQPYNFNKKIYLSYCDDKQKNIYDQFYACNIIEFFYIINNFSNQLVSTYNNIINVRYCIPSLIDIVERKIDSFQSAKGLLKGVSQFLYDNLNLMEALLFMVIDDANNIMKVFKGILIKYEQTNQDVLKQDQKPLKIHNNMAAHRITYSIQNSIFTIKILYKYQDIGQSHAKNVQESKLISRKQFLQMIFESTEFLTDYFLNKNQITTQLVKISQSLSQRLNMTVNCTVDFTYLYKFIDNYKKVALVRQIDGFLSQMRRYILTSFQKNLNNYINSKQIKDRHSILMYNKFQSIDKKIPLQQIYEQKQFIYDGDPNSKQDFSLKEIRALQDLRCMDVNEISIKNMYLIQIYKSYFASVVRQGMTFIVGYKNTSRTPISLKIKNKEDIDAINISEVGFLLLVNNTLPTNDEINHSKIIKLFAVDMNSNIYELSSGLQKQLLNLPEQSQDRNICQFVPSIQQNIILNFKSELGGNKQCKDDDRHKYFTLNMNQKREYRLIPNQSNSIHLRNYLKIDTAYNDLITNFMSIIKQNHHLNLKVNLPKSAQKIVFFECLRYFIYDIQNILLSIFIQPQRNTQLEAYVSIENKQNIFENYIVLKKQQLFRKIFDCIQVNFSEQQNKIVIPQGEKNIKVFLKIGKQMATLDRNILYKTIMYELIKRIRARISQSEKYCFDQSDDRLMSILDHLCIAESQLSAIKNAIKVVNSINDGKMGQEFSIKIDKNSKTKIIWENDALTFVISSASPTRVFFSEKQILSYLLNNKQQISENITTTQYLPQSKLIQVVNYHQVCNAKIVLVEGQNAKSQQILLNHDQTKITRAIYGFENSQNYQKYYIIQQIGGLQQVCCNYFPKFEAGPQIVNKNNNCFINEWSCILVKAPIAINLNKCPINYVYENKNEQIVEKCSITKNYANIAMQLYMLDNCTLFIKFKSMVSCSLKFLLESYVLLKDASLKSLNINIVSKNNMVIEKTRFVEVRFRGKPKKVKNLDINDSNKKNIVFKEPPQKLIGQMSENRIEKRDVQSMVYIVNQSAKKYITRAGQKRIDVITLCDDDGNPVAPNLQQINIFFKHLNLQQTIKPTICIEDIHLLLEWEPYIRGPYEIFLNNIRLNPEYQMGVCAGCADISLSKIVIPQKRTICYGEQTEFMLQLKDSHGNIYTELEENIIGDKLLIDVISSDENKKIKTRNQNINKYGFKKVKFWVDDPIASNQQDISIEILLNKQSMAKFDLHLAGQALQERMKKLQTDISKLLKGYSKQVLVSRRNFLQDLFKIAERSLLTNFSIKFTGEQGIDAGGLKRQFYDMIGSQFKKDTNPFFKCVDSAKGIYFLNPIILKNKKKKQYMELLGKYLANSILNGYLIGVNFSSVFIKMLFKDQITYQDMFDVLPKDQSDRYKYLLKAQPEQFQDLQLYFSIVVDRKKGLEVQLKEDGKQIQVSKDNVQEYLQLMTKVLITDRFKDVIDDFRNGFEDVIKLHTVTKWVRPEQFWSLTIGIKELNADLVINYINFTGGKQMHENWLRRYLKESNHQILEGFLKFASGSSSIDFYQTYKVVVRFQQSGANPKKLPISHTCWKQIIIPCYKTYDIMKQLLNAAFIYCSEGFGLA